MRARPLLLPGAKRYMSDLNVQDEMKKRDKKLFAMRNCTVIALIPLKCPSRNTDPTQHDQHLAGEVLLNFHAPKYMHGRDRKYNI